MDVERRDSSLRLGMRQWSRRSLSPSRRPAELRYAVDIVEIVEPLQHDTLHAGGFEFAQLCRNLLGSTDDLTLGPKLVGALAGQALGKLVIVFAEDDPRHQRPANLAGLPSLLAQQIVEQPSALAEAIGGEVNAVPFVREARRQRKRASPSVAADDDREHSLTHRIGHELGAVQLVELPEVCDGPLIPQEAGHDFQSLGEAL